MADEKLVTLRAWMTMHAVDAYLVPHSDRFQSEYLPPSEERLAWLTGFTGSAGMAAILSDKAALFTDGRYTLQAPQQVDTNFYTVVESPPESPLKWLSAHVSSGAKIGFDPWLFTVSQLAQWQKSPLASEWTFVPLEENPVDAMWQDKPSEMVRPAYMHDDVYAGQSVADKIAIVLKKMAPAAHALLIAEPGLVCWLLNMRGVDIAHTPLVLSMALVAQDGTVTLFVDPAKITQDLMQHWGSRVLIEPLERLFAVLQDAPAPVQIDPAQCPVAVKTFCTTHDVAVIEATDPTVLLRACKNETEIKNAAMAHEIDARAFVKFREWFAARDFSAETITELDIVEKLRHCRMENNSCLDDSFDTIAGYGSNGAIVHYHADKTSNKRLVEGSLLLLDSGGQYREGTTDITRVFAIGTPTAQMKMHYTAVLKGLIALSCARFPIGTAGIQLDALARAPIWALGLDYAHGTGHGVGSYMSVHEGPAGISMRNTVPLQAGMILSIEPGIYLAGEYGIRLENLVVVIEDKREGDLKDMLAFKTLTCVPFEDALIDEDMLSQDDQLWLAKFNHN